MQKRSEFAVSLFLLAPFLFVVVMAPYVPNRNEAWQLHAASRLASGLGYTTYWNVPEDVAGIHGDFLIAWPPGYSLIIEFLMRLGLSVFDAAKLFKVFLIVTAVSLWLAVSQQFLRRSFARAVFVIYLCFSAVFISFSPTDLFCWGSMGLLTLVMLAYADSGSVRNLYAGGIVLGAMILMRYHSLFLLPVAAIWCFFSFAPGTNKGRMLRSVGILLFPILVHLGIALTNITNEGSLSTVTAAGVQSGVQWVWLRELPHVLLLDGFFFSTALARLPLGTLSTWRAELASGLGWGVLVGFVLILGKNLREQHTGRRHLARWLLLSSIVLVFFLGYVSVTRYSQADWAPITEERYYWILSPLVLLIVLMSITEFVMGRVQLKWEHVGFASVMALGLIAIAGYAMNRYQRYSNDARLAHSLITKIEAISKSESADRMVLFSDQFLESLLLHGNFPIYRNSDGQLPSNCRFSRPTTLVWVLKDPEDFAWRWSPSIRSDSTEIKARFFWKTFLPGSFSAQIGTAETRSAFGSASQFSTRETSSSQLNDAAVSDESMAGSQPSRAVCLKPRNQNLG